MGVVDERNYFHRNSVGILLSIITLISMGSGLRISLTPQELSLKKTGDTFAIICNVDEIGDGEAAATEEQKPKWTKVGDDGQETDIPKSGGRVFARSGSGTSQMLMVEKAEKDDAGVYKCSFGDKSMTIPVKLYRSVTFVDTPIAQHPTNGQDAIIKCQADGDPAPEISWSKNDVSLGEGENDRFSVGDSGDLTINAYDTEKDDGVYKCEALQKETGLLESREINVTGFVAPSSVNIELSDKEKWSKGIHEDALNVRLTCTATGVPAPFIKWIKNDAELSAGDRYNIPVQGVLEIKNMTPEDVGPYRCEATNVVGKGEKEHTLNIYLKPQITKFETAEPSVVFGNDFSSTCSYTGGETLTAVWTRNENQIAERTAPAAEGEGSTTEGSGEGAVETAKESEPYVIIKDKTATLHIKSADLEDAGEYKCVVTNEAGSASESMKLEVRKAPTITAYTIGKVRAIIGQEYSIFCEVSAVPDPTWTWSKKGGEAIVAEEGKYEILSDGKNTTLKLWPIINDDFGFYVCKADNKVEPPAETTIELMQIEVPLAPELSHCDVDSAKPSSVGLKIDTFSTSQPENRRPTKIDIVVLSKSTGEQLRTSAQEFAHDGLYKITQLEPSTAYTFNVTGQNEAGIVFVPELDCSTTDPMPPGKPIFKQTSPFDCAVADCPLEWTVEDDGGSAITGYEIEYRPFPKEGESESEYTKATSSENKFVFGQLLSARKYDVKVKASNAKGAGQEATIVIMAPDEALQVVGDEQLNYSSTGPSTGAIVGIVVIIVLIIVVLVDVACYYVNQCGLLMCICVNLCGKTPPEVKAKEVMMEEGGGGGGGGAKDTRFEERQEKQPMSDEPLPGTDKMDTDANESTPMIVVQRGHEHGKDITTV